MAQTEIPMNICPGCGSPLPRSSDAKTGRCSRTRACNALGAGTMTYQEMAMYASLMSWSNNCSAEWAAMAKYYREQAEA